MNQLDFDTAKEGMVFLSVIEICYNNLNYNYTNNYQRHMKILLLIHQILL